MPKIALPFVLSLVLLVTTVAPPAADVIYAEPMKAVIPTPVVVEIGEIDSPVLSTAVALRLMEYAREEFQQRTGWECLNPIWDPQASATAPRNHIVELRAGLYANDISNTYSETVELDVQPRGGRLAQGIGTSTFGISSESDPLVASPLEGELFDPRVIDFIAGQFYGPLVTSMLIVDGMGVKPCAFKLKLQGRRVQKQLSGATFTTTRTWAGEGSAWMVADGVFRTNIDASIQTTYESNNTGGGVSVNCSGSGSGQERITIEGAFDNASEALRFTDVDGADPNIRLSGDCHYHTDVMSQPGLGVIAPERTWSAPIAESGINQGLGSPGDFLGGNPLLLAFGDGLKVSVPKPPRLRDDEWEMTIELVYTGRL